MSSESIIYEVVLSGLPDAPTAGRLEVPTAPPGGARASDRRTIRFQYDPAWLRTGFALGVDLPLGRDPIRPRSGRMLFQFLEERRASPEAAAWQRALRGELDEAASLGIPREAFDAIERPHAFAHRGGIDLVRRGSAAGLRTKVPSESTQLDQLLYDFHASMRGREEKGAAERLSAAALMPGRHSLFVVRQGRDERTAVIPRPEDPASVPVWRAVLLALARSCGVETEDFSLRPTLGERVLTVSRADRTEDPETGLKTAPRLTLSAAALAKPSLRTKLSGAPARVGYLALADLLAREGEAPKRDLPKVWRRMVFTRLTGGIDRPERWLFFRAPLGWALAPAFAFSILPPEVDEGPRSRMTLDGRRMLEAPEDAVALAPYFAMSTLEAKSALFMMERALYRWRDAAEEFGADPRETAWMAAAFEAAR